MNKYLLKLCLLASIANVSAASFIKPNDLTLDDDSHERSQEVSNSPLGHHVSGGAAGSLPGVVSAIFPAALKVTFNDRTSTVSITPKMRVAELIASLTQQFAVSGGHRFMSGKDEIMHTSVDARTNALITLADIFSGQSGIVAITIVLDPTRSPLQSKTSTPVPQSGGESTALKGYVPLAGGRSPETKLEKGGQVSDSSLGNDATPPKATEPDTATATDADIPAVTE